MPRQVAQCVGQGIPIRAELGRKFGRNSQGIEQILLAFDALEIGIEQRKAGCFSRAAQGFHTASQRIAARCFPVDQLFCQCVAQLLCPCVHGYS